MDAFAVSLQVSAEVKSFSAPKSAALNLRESFQTEGGLNAALKHCFLLQGVQPHILAFMGNTSPSSLFWVPSSAVGTYSRVYGNVRLTSAVLSSDL